MRCDPRPRLRPGRPEHGPPPPPILGAELTQAVQHFPFRGEGPDEPPGTVTLVEGIPLMARVYVDGGGLPGGVASVVALAAIRDEAGAVVATARSAGAPPGRLADPRRADVGSTLNLSLPGHACRGPRTVRLALEIEDGGGGVAELTAWEMRIAFLPVPDMPVVVVALELDSTTVPAFGGRIPAPPAREHPVLIEGARRHLPVPAMPVLATVTPPTLWIDDLSLGQVYAYLVGLGNLTTAPSMTLGLIGRDWTTVDPGVLGRGGAGVTVVSSGTPEVAAHEVGHVLGRLHSTCGGQSHEDPRFPASPGLPAGATGEWGLRLAPGPQNTTVFEAPGPDHLDYMGDGSCMPAWTSPYGWRRALAGARYCLWRRRLSRRLWMLADITVTDDDNASLGPSPVADTAPPPPLGAPSEWEAELLDARRRTLTRVRLHGLDIPGQAAGNGLPQRFIEAIPWHGDAVALLVRRKGKPVELLGFAPEDPPLEGVALATTETGDRARITWEPEEGATYLVRYTPDDGATWFGLAAGIGGDEIELDLTGLPAGEANRLELTATRGGRSTAVLTRPFARAPAPLEAHIAHPAPGDEPAVIGAGMVELVGWAGSPDLPELPGEALRWELAVPGSDEVVALGRGRRLLIPTELLGGGEGTITLVADGGVLGVPSATDAVRIARGGPDGPVAGV